MKKFLITIIVLGLIAGLLVATCPDAQKHRDVVNNRIEQGVSDYLKSENLSGEGLAGIFSSAISSLAGKLSLASNLKVRDYALFSLGTVDTTDKENQIVSLGLFNHVICFISEDDVKEFIDGSLQNSGLFNK